MQAEGLQGSVKRWTIICRPSQEAKLGRTRSATLGKSMTHGFPVLVNYREEHVCIVTLYLMGQFAFSYLDVLDAHRRSDLILLHMVSYHFDGVASYDICRYMHGVHIC
jgi:hypothetical protein